MTPVRIIMTVKPQDTPMSRTGAGYRRWAGPSPGRDVAGILPTRPEGEDGNLPVAQVSGEGGLDPEGSSRDVGADVHVDAMQDIWCPR